jgi:hypothetical protein
MDDRTHKWVSFFESRKQSRHEPSASGANTSKACFPLNFGVTRMHVGFDVLQLMNNPASPLDNDNTFVRQGTTVALD